MQEIEFNIKLYAEEALVAGSSSRKRTQNENALRHFTNHLKQKQYYYIFTVSTKSTQLLELRRDMTHIRFKKNNLLENVASCSFSIEELSLLNERLVSLFRNKLYASYSYMAKKLIKALCKWDTALLEYKTHDVTMSCPMCST